jgi:hypothetical protein
MDEFVKPKQLKNQKGQTSIEWLLLTAVAFMTAYIAITGPFSRFTLSFINNIKSVTRGIVQNGEIRPDAAPPSTPSRLKGVHL